MKVIIAGGGTGGHIFPALAIGHAIMRHYPKAKVLFVGAKHKMEMEKVPQEGFEIIGLDIAGFNRGNLLSNWNLPFKLFKSHLEAKKIIKNFEPNIVIGVGGYASYPMLNAAQKLEVPTLIQEQNSHAGKSNMLLGKKARKICVAYEGMDKFFPAEKVVLTGNPVRKLIVENHKTQAEGKQAFGLGVNKKTILVVGGSLGALSINKVIAKDGQKLSKKYQILWQTGKHFYGEAMDKVKDENIIIKEFIRNMDDAYAAADIIVSRAGAMAISELCIVGKPVVFVPYPFAAEDHQTVNARSLVEKYAAEMVANDEVDRLLIDEVKALVEDEPFCNAMAENIKKLAITDADERIMKEIENIVNPAKTKS